MMKIIFDYLDDVIILAGLAVVVYATWLVNAIAGLYALGIALVAVGALVGMVGDRKPTVQHREEKHR